MAPTLQKVILNGASRHRLNKGFILVGDGGRSVTAAGREQFVQLANQSLAGRTDLTGYTVEARPQHISLIGLVTPFLPVYTPLHRNAFITGLATATGVLLQSAARLGYRLTATGVNPFATDGDGPLPALCADLHQVEVFDDGEIERIYNLYRQFLPELLAISTHSAVYGGTLQKDFSLRMRVNPSSFLPRYLSQFSGGHLDKLRSMMRKDYGLAELRQMDVNPLAGDPDKLAQNHPTLLSPLPAAAELRFIDAQCAYPFIRAQIILFQAIAMYGRSLTRQGKRLPYMRDEVIDENKALAIQNGPGAMLRPDAKFKKDDGGRGYSYHDKGEPERATTSLLAILEGLLLPYLHALGCQYEELAPIVLGAELRRRGRQCFANYAEYQKYLHYTNAGRFAAVQQQQMEQLLTTPHLDHLTDYNRRTYAQLSQEIGEDWTEKLRPQARQKGQVKWYNPGKGYGFIRAENGEEIHVQRDDIEGVTQLQDGQPVTFEILKRRGRLSAVRVRVQIQERQTGRVIHFNESKGFGFIQVEGEKVYVHRSDTHKGESLQPGDTVTLEVVEEERGPRAIRVEVQEQPRLQGQVKFFNTKKNFGYLTMDDGREIFVHKNDLETIEVLQPKQKVSFEVVETPKGPKAIRVQVVAKG